MTKKLAKDVVSRIKKKNQTQEKGNFTFSLTRSLVEDFKKKCTEEQVSMASVIEQMIQDFTNN